MDLNIRVALKEKLANISSSELLATITDAIKSGEEQLLPGLGYLFELQWSSKTKEEQTLILDALTAQLASQ